MTVDIDHYIFRFQVSIYDVLLMHNLESQKDFSCIEFYPFFLVLLSKEQVHLVLYQPI